MVKQKKHKEIEELYKIKGYELLNEYKNNRTKLFLKDEYGYICSTSWSSFIQGKSPSKIHPRNPYTIQNIKLWMKTNAIGYELLSKKYNNAKDKLLFNCNIGHEFYMSWDKFKLGERCPYCCNSPKPKLGINTIWDTDRWMCDLGVSEEDAKTHTRCSTDKITVTCPNCSKEKIMAIHQIYNAKSISCDCKDGVSYPEKFIISLLDQLGIEYVKEYIPKWSCNKRYDFYFELSNKKYIIEAHGNQHYNDDGFIYNGGRTLREEQENDTYKKQLALNNGIDEYIVLDCRKSELDWIKSSVIQSKLNDIFDLCKINWTKCEEFALSNRVKEICDYWNNKQDCETTKDIGYEFNLNRRTVNSYLRKGTKLGWCNYNGKEEMKKQASKNGSCYKKPVEIYKNGISLGVFESIVELEKQSEELFGVKLNNGNISQVCNGKKSQYKGFTFVYVTDK